MDDASGEQWDRDMREIRAGRVVNADSDQWIVYRDMVDRAVKAEAEVKRLQEANMELQKTDNHYADECVMLKREIELREIEREDMLKSIERLQSDKPVRPRKLTAVLRESVSWADLRMDEDGGVPPFTWLAQHAGQRIEILPTAKPDIYAAVLYMSDMPSGLLNLRAEWLEDIREEWTPQKGELMMGKDPVEGCWRIGWYSHAVGDSHVMHLKCNTERLTYGTHSVDEIRPIEEV